MSSISTNSTFGRAGAALDYAQRGQVSFLANAKYAKHLETTRASAAVVGMNVRSEKNPSLALLKAKDTYYTWSRAVVLLRGHRKHPHAGVHPKANIDPTATIGEGTVIYPGVYVGARAKVGRDCVLYPNVVVYEECV